MKKTVACIEQGQVLFSELELALLAPSLFGPRPSPRSDSTGGLRLLRAGASDASPRPAALPNSRSRPIVLVSHPPCLRSPEAEAIDQRIGLQNTELRDDALYGQGDGSKTDALARKGSLEARGR